MSDRSDAILAAEHVLGLLEGEDRLAAVARAASDPAFAAEIAVWEERLAPVLDEIPAHMPREAVWQRIEAELAGDSGTAEVIALRRRLRRWQWVGGLSAAAAVAFAFLALPQLSDPTEEPTEVAAAPGLTQPPMAANMPIEGTPLSLDFTYLPDAQSLLVGAVGLEPDGVHDHEIWFVPPEGELVSLGIVTPGKVVAHSVPREVARALHNGSQIVLTVEPLGGKPADAEAGPVVAEARFTTI